MAGPIPKRSEDRVRRNQVDITKGVMFPVREWEPKRGWHRLAKETFEAIGSSGQSQYFQDSDWAIATVLCEELSEYKKEEDRKNRQLRKLDRWEKERDAWDAELEGKPFSKPKPSVPRGGSAMKLTAILQKFSDLMMTEADRRRLRIELQLDAEEKEESAEIMIMKQYREMIGG